MTIVVGWTRKTRKGAEELLMVSDSRLNGGGNLDTVPKLFLLPRTDCVIGMSGNTLISYPLLTQLSQSINFHHPLRDRVIDYIPLRTHLLKVMNELFKAYDTYDDDLKKPDSSFLLGGYSWFRKEFCLDRIFFNRGLKKFDHLSARSRGNGFKLQAIGDWAGKVESSLNQKIRSEKITALHMEPFETVRDLLRASRKSYTIGGAPQLVSVSQHMNSNYTGVYWPTRGSGNVYLGGRQVLPFESVENWVLDPDSLTKHHAYYPGG